MSATDKSGPKTLGLPDQVAHPIFSFADAEMGPIASRIIRSVEKISGQPKIRKLYFDYVEDNLPAKNFWFDALNRLDITVDLSREDGAYIPKTGPMVAVANHPYGVIDGLVLCSLVSAVRDDYKIITHRVLRQAPATMDKILPVDFDETEAALETNLQTRIAATQHLKNDGAVIIFPAGSISLAPKVVGDAFDIEWKTFAAKLATHQDTVTVPFLFDGRNSVLFQAVRRTSQTLGYSLMFREICNLMGTTVSLTMRKPLLSVDLRKIGNRKDVAKHLRDVTYDLQSGGDLEANN